MPATTAAKEAPIEEVPDVEPQTPKTVLKTRNIDQEAVDKAAERAAQDAVSMTIGSIPKTTAGFETDLRQLKNNTANIYQYLKNIPLQTLATIFKASEVQAEILAPALQSFAAHGLSTSSNRKHTADFLLTWSKSPNFDMTLMFIDDKEKKLLETIGSSIRQEGTDLHNRYQKVFGSL